MGQVDPPQQLFLTKYGDRKHIEPLYRFGKLRVSPASAYADRPLNTAIKGDELTISLRIDPTRIDFANASGHLAGSPLARAVRVQQRALTDYYICCFAAVLQARLFFDFEYDACLIVKEPDVFLARLSAAMTNVLPEWNATGGFVRYYEVESVVLCKIG